MTVFIAALLIAPKTFAARQTVTDELVKDLSCSDVRPASIYSAVDRTAYRSDRVIPTENYIKNLLGQCWALAKFQRLNLLLGRTTLPVSTTTIDRMARGFDYVSIAGSPLSQRQPLTQVSAFGMTKDKTRYDNSSSYDETLRSKDVPGSRDFFQAIELSQTRLFYRTENTKFLRTTPSSLELKRELAKIFGLANKKMLPMVALRENRISQHVVLIDQAFQIAPKRWRLNLIDSNSTRLFKRVLNIEENDGRFKMCYGPPLDYLENWCDSSYFINVESITLVGEDERPMIDAALVRHYKNICRN